MVPQETDEQRCASNVAIRRYREKREADVAAEAAAAEAKAAPSRSLRDPTSVSPRPRAQGKRTQYAFESAVSTVKHNSSISHDGQRDGDDHERERRRRQRRRQLLRPDRQVGIELVILGIAIDMGSQQNIRKESGQNKISPPF